MSTAVSGAKFTVFGLPYAGGNMWSYRPLEKSLPPGVTLTGIELPGRGRRSNEPLATSIDTLADDVAAQIRSRADGPYALFGHSMGALLGLLTIRRLAQSSQPLPEVFFVSGCEAPAMRTPRRRYALGPQEFIDMLHEMGGCPPEVLADQELLDFFEPILRADFQAFETWPAVSGPKIDVPIVVSRGSEDEVSEEAARAWGLETRHPITYAEFSGGHFFLLQHWPAIGAMIRDHVKVPR
jgi:surfactin synthase thioesterase subunit